MQILGFESILSKIMREEFVKRIRHEREFTMNHYESDFNSQKF